MVANFNQIHFFAGSAGAILSFVGFAIVCYGAQFKKRHPHYQHKINTVDERSSAPGAKINIADTKLGELQKKN